MSRATAENRNLAGQVLEYLRDTKARTEDTLRTYAGTYEDLINWLGNTRFADATDERLQDYVNMPMRQRRGDRGAGSAPSNATKKRRRTEINTLYKTLYQKRLVDRVPHVEAPEGKKVAPRPINDQVWVDLWAADLCDEDRVALGLERWCGLRASEVARLEPTSAKGDELVDFWQKGDKPGSKFSGRSKWYSNVCFFAEAQPHLMPGGIESFTDPFFRLLDKRRGCRFVFGGWLLSPLRVRAQQPEGSPIDRRVVEYRFRLDLERAGHPEAVRVEGPHACRHACGTYALRGGMEIYDVKTLMRHNSVTSTECYLLVDEDPAGKHVTGAPAFEDLLANFSGRRAS